MAKIQKQERLRAFIEREVIINQSMLVEWLLDNGQFVIDDIENLYPQIGLNTGRCCECGGEDRELDEDEMCADCQGPQEIFEWWLVTSWFAEKLKKHGEPILTNDYGTWWGRTCTGQAIYLDGVIEMIYDHLQ